MASDYTVMQEDRNFAEHIWALFECGDRSFAAETVARHRHQSIAPYVEALRGLVAAVNTNSLASAMACHSVADFTNVEDALKPALALLSQQEAQGG